MRARRILVTLAALVAIAGVTLTAYRREALRRPALCQVCGREVPKQTAYRMDTAQGTIKACCPTCAMHYMMHHPGAVHAAWASDYGSGRMLAAATAYYDARGDVHYCTARQPPVERGSQGISVRAYDRCLPTLVAFATRDRAETYRQQHGGRILTYDEAFESVRNH